jgi:hypothetical protein
LERVHVQTEQGGVINVLEHFDFSKEKDQKSTPGLKK